MKKTLLLFLLCCSTSARGREAQKAPPLLNRHSLEKNIVLNEPWKFHPGDDTLWAQKDFPDEGWKQSDTYLDLSSGKSRDAGFEGIGWFRYHFRTDSSLNDFPLSLQLTQNGASEVFLDGRRIVRFGQFKKEGGPIYVDPGIQPVIFLIPEAGEHVLAVRHENYKAQSRYEQYDEDMAGFRLTIADPKQSISKHYRLLLITAILLFSSGCVFLTLCITHLILFLFYRKSLSNLYFSLFNLGLGVLILASFLYINHIWIDQSKNWMGPISLVTLSLCCFSMSALVNDLFGKKKLRFRIITCLCLLVVLFTIINPSSDILLPALVASTAIICGLEALIILCSAMYRRIEGARIIGIGIVFFILFFAAIIIVVLFNGGNIEMEGGVLSFLVSLLAFLALFSVPFSMSAYLAWSFATTSRNLKVQLKQVKRLSEEKQQILHDQKEKLELEVAERTSEVMKQKAQIEEQHEALKTEKKKSDDLLLNILPAEVAEELKEKGTTKAQSFDHVTVLFTDFVNFTRISEQRSPQALVQELDECFRAFDDIMERHGLEKIKTIGDAYLAVSGMPAPDEQHAYHAVAAALEIIHFIKARRLQKPTFDIRVGIHSGSLVAGIVGIKKFAYDIWGDTVNTASRMESSSEPGKVNISGDTYALVKEDFRFTYRGKINAKNKGEMDMYFVESMPVVI